MLHTPLSGLRFLSKYTSQACLLTDIWSKKKKIMLKQQEVIILNISPGPAQAFLLQYIYLNGNMKLGVLALTYERLRLSVVLIPRQMASNSRGPPWGGSRRRSWTLQACLICRVGPL